MSSAIVPLLHSLNRPPRSSSGPPRYSGAPLLARQHIGHSWQPASPTAGLDVGIPADWHQQQHLLAERVDRAQGQFVDRAARTSLIDLDERSLELPKARVHELRHTLASPLVAAKGDVVTISELLRHARNDDGIAADAINVALDANSVAKTG